MNNPIIERELIGMLRTRKALGIMFFLAATLAVLVVLRWPTDAQVDISGAAAQQVFRVFGYGLMTMLILLVPVFPATTIVRERVGGTLALLLNSPMSQWSIYMGKLVGVIGFVLLLILMSVPAAAACFAMGGIDLTSHLLKLYVILFLVAVQYATLGLLVSSYANSTDSALRTTYGLILLLAVVVMGPYQFLQGGSFLPAVEAARWLRAISPIPAVMDILGHGDVGSQGLSSGGGDAGRYAVLAILSTIGFVIWTASRLNQTMLDRARAQGRITDERSAGEQRRRRIFYIWFFDPQRRTQLIGTRWGYFFWMLALSAVLGAAAAVIGFYFFGGEPAATPGAPASAPAAPATPQFKIGMFNMVQLGQLMLLITVGAASLACFIMAVAHLAVTNPVTAKEFRCRRFGRSHWMARLVAICALVSLGLTFASAEQSMSWAPETVGGIMVLLQVALIVLLTPSLAAGLISSERESGGWTLLQMTPLSAASIVVGKLMSVVATLLLLLMATLPGYIVMIYIKPEMLHQILNVLVCLLLTAAFALMLSAAMSSLFRRTAPATTVSYTILVGICAGSMLFWLGRDAPFSHQVVEAVLRFNPMAAALQIIEVHEFTRYDLVPANWYIVGGLTLLCIGTLAVQTVRLTRPQ